MQWNIYREGYHSLTREIRCSANRAINSHVIYLPRGKDEKDPQEDVYPRLVAKGAKMTRKMAYRLMRFYCNKKKIYYEYGELNELVDDIYGVEEEEDTLSETLRVLDAKRHMDAVDSYQEELQQDYLERYVN